MKFLRLKKLDPIYFSVFFSFIIVFLYAALSMIRYPNILSAQHGLIHYSNLWGTNVWAFGFDFIIFILPSLFLVWIFKKDYIFIEHRRIKNKKALCLAGLLFLCVEVFIQLIFVLFYASNIALNHFDIIYFISHFIKQEVNLFLTEELLFYGIILNAIAAKYATTKANIIIFCVCFFSVLLGCSHFPIKDSIIYGRNIFIYYLNYCSVFQYVVEVVRTICFGCFATSVYLRSKNIYIIFILHFLNNLLKYSEGDFSILRITGQIIVRPLGIFSGHYGMLYAVVILLECLLFLGATWLVLRKNGFREIIANFKKEA